MFPSQAEFLRHILDECRYLRQEYSTNNFEEFQHNERLIRAICRSLEIIGEACSKIHPDIKAKYPLVDWRAMSDMRNKIIHFYFGIDYDVGWDTVKTDIPILEQNISLILGQLDTTHL